MKNMDLTDRQAEVINNWLNDGASISIQHLSLVEDALLEEHIDGTTPYLKLRLIREIRLLSKELAAFTPEQSEKGGKK